MVRVYLSYSHADEAMARKLTDDLVGEGIEVMSADQVLKPGDSLMQKIPEAIHRVDAVLILLSRHSLESASVGPEVAFAVSENLRVGRPLVVPVLLERGVRKPSLLVDKVHADFSGSEDYDSELLSLVERLRMMREDTFGEEGRATDQEAAFLRAQKEMLEVQRLELDRARVAFTRRVAVIVTLTAGLTSVAYTVFFLAGALDQTLVVVLSGLTGFLLGCAASLIFGLLAWQPLAVAVHKAQRLLRRGLRRGARGEGYRDG